MDHQIMDLDTKISMSDIKANLRQDRGDYDPRYTQYLADRLPGECSPREFFQWGNQLINELSSGQSSDPTKPIPGSVVVYARKQGSFLLTDFGIALSQKYCPQEFAKGVRKLHRELYLE